MRKRILQNIKKCGSLLLIKTFNTIFLRDLKEGLHQDTKTWFTVSFFLLCLLVFPLAVGAIEDVLEKIAVAAIWISALFANLLALENMFKEDYEEGILEQYIMSGISLKYIVISKCLIHWIFSGLPIIVIAPFCLYFYDPQGSNNLRLIISLLLGTPLLTLIGSPIAALTLGHSLRGAMLAFLTIPFYFPVLIFGVLSTKTINSQSNAEFYLLSAFLSLGIVVLPLITVKILRFILE